MDDIIETSPVLGADGTIYVGSCDGTLYALMQSLPPTIASFTPTSGGVGTTVKLTGTNFIGATAVAFGGKAATAFTVVSDTSITATVGSGATGTITVTTPGGTAASTDTFTFVPAITGLTLSATPTSPVVLGTSVHLNAVAAGGYKPEYEFYALYWVNGGNQQVMIRDYALSSTCTWTPTLIENYTLVACAREHGSTVAYAAYGTEAGYDVVSKLK